MNQAQFRQDAIRKYGDAPANPGEALLHVLAVYADEPDSRQVLEATRNVYGDGVVTGLTLGDLRAIRDVLIGRAASQPVKALPGQDR